VRLFNRTTRSLRATAHGELFYKGAIKILDTIREVEGGIAEITAQPKGTLFISAPLALGKKLVAPLIPAFKAEYPDINVRLRLSDRKVDIAQEGLDAAFVLGPLPDSDLRVRAIHDFERVLVASPGYIKTHGMPQTATRSWPQAQMPAAALSRRNRVLLEPAASTAKSARFIPRARWKAMTATC
jgi:LysR family transcriptional activator of dmlA